MSNNKKDKKTKTKPVESKKEDKEEDKEEDEKSETDTQGIPNVDFKKFLGCGG